MKSVLSTKGKYLRFGKKPEFGAWKFIVMFCFGTIFFAVEHQVFSNVKQWRSNEAEVFAEKTNLAFSVVVVV